MQDVSEFDSKVRKANEEYLNALTQADKLGYDVSMKNMEKAEAVEERQSIRDRMAEMKKERYQKDSENIIYYDK